jgi:hypothetical protein
MDTLIIPCPAADQQRTMRLVEGDEGRIGMTGWSRFSEAPPLTD